MNDYDIVIYSNFLPTSPRTVIVVSLWMQLHTQTGSVTLRFCGGGLESLDACTSAKIDTEDPRKWTTPWKIEKITL